MQKTIKADIELRQPLLKAITAGRTMEMVNILKHELSPIPLSLATHESEINSTQKAELISVLVDGLHTPLEVPEANTKTCVLIDGLGLIRAFKKSRVPDV